MAAGDPKNAERFAPEGVSWAFSLWLESLMASRSKWRCWIAAAGIDADVAGRAVLTCQQWCCWKESVGRFVWVGQVGGSVCAMTFSRLVQRDDTRSNCMCEDMIGIRVTSSVAFVQGLAKQGPCRYRFSLVKKGRAPIKERNRNPEV